MKKQPMQFLQLLLLSTLLCLSTLSAAYADENNYQSAIGDYQAAIRTPAEANATKMYSAWGKNMAHHIKRGAKEGVVIEGSGTYADGQIEADGVGNVVVKEGANIKGPIINETKLDHTPVIIMQESGDTRMPRQ